MRFGDLNANINATHVARAQTAAKQRTLLGGRRFAKLI